MQNSNNQISDFGQGQAGRRGSGGRTKSSLKRKGKDPIAQAYANRRTNVSRRSRQNRHSRQSSLSLTAANNDEETVAGHRHNQSMVVDNSNTAYTGAQLLACPSQMTYEDAKEEAAQIQSSQPMEPKLEYQSRGDDMEVENLKELHQYQTVAENEYNQKYGQPQEDLASRMLALDASNPYANSKEFAAREFATLNESRRSRVTRSSRLSKQISGHSEKENRQNEPLTHSQYAENKIESCEFRFNTPSSGKREDTEAHEDRSESPGQKLELEDLSPPKDHINTQDEALTLLTLLSDDYETQSHLINLPSGHEVAASRDQNGNTLDEEKFVKSLLDQKKKISGAALTLKSYKSAATTKGKPKSKPKPKSGAKSNTKAPKSAEKPHLQISKQQSSFSKSKAGSELEKVADQLDASATRSPGKGGEVNESQAALRHRYKQRRSERTQKSNYNHVSMIEIKQEDIFVAESPCRDSSAKKHSTAKKAGSKSATKSVVISQEQLVDMMIAAETGSASGSELGSREDSLERTNKSLIVPASSARKNLRHQKDLIAAKLNTRLQRLAKHKEAGDLQFERARLQIKDFYKQVKAKIDDIESKAQSDLRAHSFIRSQNFVKMVGQVQKQIELLATEGLKASENGANATVQQADAFLASGDWGESPNEEATRAQQKALGSTLQSISEISEIQRGERVAKFPGYTQDVLAKIVRVEFNLKDYNCNKNDFINSQLRIERHDSPTRKKNKGGHEKKKSATNMANSSYCQQIINSALQSSRAADKAPPTHLDYINKDNFASTMSLVNNKQQQNNNAKIVEQKVLSFQQSMLRSKAQALERYQSKRDQRPGTAAREVNKYEEPLSTNLSNYQPSQVETKGSIMHSPHYATATDRSGAIADTSMNIASRLLGAGLGAELEPKGSSKGENQPDSNNQTAKAGERAKHLAEEIKQIEKKFLKPGLSAKQKHSIQSHIARLQNYASQEPVERLQSGNQKSENQVNARAGASVPAEKQARDASKCADPQTHGCISQTPVLSNIKTHQGHTFAKSSLRSRGTHALLYNGQAQTTDSGGEKNMFEQTRGSMQKSTSTNKLDPPPTSNINTSGLSSKGGFIGLAPKSVGKALPPRTGMLRVGSQDTIEQPGFGSDVQNAQARQALKQTKQNALARSNLILPQHSNSLLARQTPHVKESSDHRPSPALSKPHDKNYATQAPVKRRTFSMSFNNQISANLVSNRKESQPEKKAAAIVKSSQVIRREGSMASRSSQRLNQNYSTVEDVYRQDGAGEDTNRSQQLGAFHGLQKRSIGGQEGTIKTTAILPKTLHQRTNSTGNCYGGGLQFGGLATQGRWRLGMQTNQPERHNNHNHNTDEDQRMDRKGSQKATSPVRRAGSPVRKAKQVILMSTAPPEEQHQLDLPEQSFVRKRMFTKIISQPDRIQFQWSHPSPDCKSEDLQYTLEYGCGIQFMGVEQFRKIYQGKAHKCIVADLNATTTYRFRVRPVRIIDDVTIEGYWSEVVSVTTLEKA